MRRASRRARRRFWAASRIPSPISAIASTRNHGDSGGGTHCVSPSRLYPSVDEEEAATTCLDERAHHTCAVPLQGSSHCTSCDH
jgi:hypothetical protein